MVFNQVQKCDLSNSQISADEASCLPEMLTCISC